MVIDADKSSIEKPDTFGVVNSTRLLGSASSEIVMLALVNENAPIVPLPIVEWVMFRREPSPVDSDRSRKQIGDKTFRCVFDGVPCKSFMIRAQKCLTQAVMHDFASQR
jgi:hypothetical protein